MSSSKKAARPVASKRTDTSQPETQQSGWLYPTIWQNPDDEAHDPVICDNPAERAGASAETIQLLAARAEARQRHSVAIAWARRAVDATRNISTQLHRDDMAYLDSLRDKRPQRQLFRHHIDIRQAGDRAEELT